MFYICIEYVIFPSYGPPFVLKKFKFIRVNEMWTSEIIKINLIVTPYHPVQTNLGIIPSIKQL